MHLYLLFAKNIELISSLVKYIMHVHVQAIALAPVYGRNNNETNIRKALGPEYISY